MTEALWKQILNSIEDSEKELMRDPQINKRKGMGVYYRFCKKCGEIYKTTRRTSKVCYFCNDSHNCNEDYYFDENDKKGKE